MLPKFLIADNSQESLGKLFVVHTEEPRFILEGNDEDFMMDQVMHWLDAPVTDPAIIEQLKEEAADFLDAELDLQEELYLDFDDEEGYDEDDDTLN